MIVRADGVVDPTINALLKATVTAAQQNKPGDIALPAVVVGNNYAASPTQKSAVGVLLVISLIIYFVLRKGIKNVVP